MHEVLYKFKKGKMIEKLNKLAVRDNKVMAKLKIDAIYHDIASTNKGELRLHLAKGETGKDYRFVLDAVPLEEKKSKELMELLDDSAIF